MIAPPTHTHSHTHARTHIHTHTCTHTHTPVPPFIFPGVLAVELKWNDTFLTDVTVGLKGLAPDVGGGGRVGAGSPLPGVI